MKALFNTTFTGHAASETQRKYATGVFNKGLNAVKAEYETIVLRVAEGSLSQKFLTAWDEVIDSEFCIKLWTRYGEQKASTVIDFEKIFVKAGAICPRLWIKKHVDKKIAENNL